MNEMKSVTGRIKSIKQPYGGYLPIRSFCIREINDGKILNPVENIHASIIGMVIDYLTRIQLGEDKKKVFFISLLGSHRAEDTLMELCVEEAKTYLRKIVDSNDESIINACKLVTFDVWYRNQIDALTAKRACDIEPDKATIQNISILLSRSVNFWENYGPVVSKGFTFLGGYTPTVFTGDGDFMTADTLWEFKVIKSTPTSKHTLQLLMYWIMGMHSNDNTMFKNIKKLGIFNPRFNRVYVYELSNLKNEIIRAVEDDVLCYKDYEKESIIDVNTTSIIDMK